MTVPFLPQEQDNSCLPACVRMVMAYHGILLAEKALRECCQTNNLGTTFPEAALCFSRYGLTVREISQAAWSDLEDWLADGVYPILSINLFPLQALWAAHAVIVEAATPDGVIFIDPLRGKREASRTAFEQAWSMRRNKALLITR
jgi:ABC-type bacteriocin/lantibiotic exporter with double-glycine peptidase domain